MIVKKTRFLSALCLLAFCLSQTAVLAANAAPVQKAAAGTKESVSQTISYDEYRRLYGDKARPDSVVRIDAAGYTAVKDMEPEVKSAWSGSEQAVLLTGDEGYVEWTFHVPLEGLYSIGVKFLPLEGKGSAVERTLYLDGAIPFSGARSLLFERVWENGGQAAVDQNGNQYRPKQVEKAGWRESFLSGTSDYYDGSYEFYFSAGTHTLGLKSVKEPMAIESITLCRQEAIPDYQEYYRALKARGAGNVPADTEPVVVQAEDASLKSDATLYPVSDHSSPANQPYAISKILLNSIGGQNWRFHKQWLEWNVTVQKSGFYRLAFRASQNYKSGSFSCRAIYIDGKIPFQEAKSLKFKFSSEWQMVTLADETETLPVYLEEGAHTLRMEVALGDMGEVLRQVESSITELNRMYRKIVMITGSFPDTLRDYNLDKAIPELLPVFKEQSELLKAVGKKLIRATGKKGQESAGMEKMSLQLDSFLKNPDTIPGRLQSFNSNISDLSAWVLSTTEQALVLDYFILQSPDTAMPEADVPWYHKLWNEITGLFLSFVIDYNTVNSAAGDVRGNRDVTLWLGSGRDQATVLKSMFDNYFTPQSGVAVKLQLVDMSVLMRAISAGKGPDIALFQSQDMPVQYSFRNAVYDLSRFEDLDEVLRRFSSSAVEPFRVGTHVYGLPEQQFFNMLFYRSDILDELDLSVPETWDQTYRLIPELQKNNMEIGLPSPFAGAAGASSVNSVFLQFLFQNGGQIYNDGRSRCVLDSATAVNAFEQWTELYNKYKFPQKMDALTRFRVGEAPLVIAPYTFYNTLLIAAPEISGLWGMSLVPGTVQTDGKTDHSTSGSVTASIIFKNAKNPDAAWEALKWWTGTEGQVTYGREMEAMQGASARWATANLEAMQRLPWTTADAKQILNQWQYVKPIPEVAGGYYTARNLDNAIRAVVNSGQDAKETLLDNIKLINDEIAIRRKEFGLK